MTTASIFPMGEPRKKGQRAIEPNQRVNHSDYGRGTIISVGPSQFHVEWDRPYTKGSSTRILVHDNSFMERLDLIEEDDAGHVKFTGQSPTQISPQGSTPEG